MEIISGNILDCKGFILHQCNCQTKGSRGLATQIFNKFPYANIYRTQRIPGNICVTYNVIGLLSQNKPGKPDIHETKEMRLSWFIQCLQKLQNINFDYLTYKYKENINGISKHILNFPYGIGCGLAGGDWETYYNILSQFATANPQFLVRIVKFEQ